jgi:hypothetical protein
MSNIRYLPGTELTDILVETISVEESHTPVARPVENFPPDTEVNLERALCNELPVGTQFRVSGTVRQRILGGGFPPVLWIDVSHASVVVDSVPDDKLRAILQKVKADNSSERVRNCSSAFKCDRSWDELTPTDATKVRHCGVCSKDVHLCETIGEIFREANDGKCVAVMAATVADDPSYETLDFVGYAPDEDDPTY